MHFDLGCGLGCQLHHRMTCVALSYAMKLPLIHDLSVWPYAKQWNEAFKQLGSNCSRNSQTIVVEWRATGPVLKVSRLKGNGSGIEEIKPFPLANGFIVSRSIAILINNVHDDPFLWWAGQFAKYTMRLSDSQELLVQRERLKIGLRESVHPIFG